MGGRNLSRGSCATLSYALLENPCYTARRAPPDTHISNFRVGWARGGYQFTTSPRHPSSLLRSPSSRLHPQLAFHPAFHATGSLFSSHHITSSLVQAHMSFTAIHPSGVLHLSDMLRLGVAGQHWMQSHHITPHQSTAQDIKTTAPRITERCPTQYIIAAFVCMHPLPVMMLATSRWVSWDRKALRHCQEGV